MTLYPTFTRCQALCWVHGLTASPTTNLWLTYYYDSHFIASGRLSHLAKTTQSRRSLTGIRTRVCLTPAPSLIITIPNKDRMKTRTRDLVSWPGQSPQSSSHTHTPFLASQESAPSPLALCREAGWKAEAKQYKGRASCL